jgi:hypothetical protein
VDTSAGLAHPLPLVARVQSAGPSARALATMARELCVVQHLVREGAPEVAPITDPAPAARFA